jgi:hypothetical protein
MSIANQRMFDLSEAFDVIEALTKTSSTVSVGMTQLLDYCESKYPHPIWIKLRALNFEGDTKNLRSWLEHILLREPPSSEIRGFWFGLFNPVMDNKTTCALYISGSTKHPSKSDWAVWNEESYLPNGRYADSKVLHEIYHLLEEHHMLGDAEYILCLGYAGLVVHSVCKSTDTKLLFGERSSRAIAVGFDSGDYIVLTVEG